MGNFFNLLVLSQYYRPNPSAVCSQKLPGLCPPSQHANKDRKHSCKQYFGKSFSLDFLGHTAGERQSQDSDPGSLESTPLSHALCFSVVTVEPCLTVTWVPASGQTCLSFARRILQFYNLRNIYLPIQTNVTENSQLKLRCCAQPDSGRGWGALR